MKKVIDLLLPKVISAACISMVCCNDIKIAMINSQGSGLCAGLNLS